MASRNGSSKLNRATVMNVIIIMIHLLLLMPPSLEWDAFFPSFSTAATDRLYTLRTFTFAFAGGRRRKWREGWAPEHQNRPSWSPLLLCDDDGKKSSHTQTQSTDHPSHCWPNLGKVVHDLIDFKLCECECIQATILGFVAATRSFP